MDVFAQAERPAKASACAARNELKFEFSGGFVLP